MKLNISLFIFSILINWKVNAEKLTLISSHELKIPEPSDICLSDHHTYLIVSDHGILYEVDNKFNILKKTSTDGFDYEGVCSYNGNIIVSDESLRQINYYSPDLNKTKTISFNYQGGRNLGMESITFDSQNNSFIGFTEKSPCLMLSFNQDMMMTSQTELKGIREISSVTYHDNSLWLLSDEEMKVYKLNPITYSILNSWDIPVINPEGICFSDNNTLLILSDDQEKIFEFNLPE